MPNNLMNHTVVVTGTAKTHSIDALIEAHGGQVLYLPLLVTQEHLNEDDAMYLDALPSYDWLIFTSQNAVDAFYAKCQRYDVDIAMIEAKIAAVGTKTKKALTTYGFTVDFVPSVFSADVFITEFPTIADKQANCLFCKGNLAKNTIEQLPFSVQSWIVYDTLEHEEHAQQLRTFLQQTTAIVTVIFSSPSAVQLYTRSVLPSIDWQHIHVASIGHITTAALQRAGATTILQPSTYTMQAVAELIIQQSEGIS